MTLVVMPIAIGQSVLAVTTLGGLSFEWPGQVPRCLRDRCNRFPLGKHPGVDQSIRSSW